MPRKEPNVSYTLIRQYAEKFNWIDASTKTMRTGFNPPPNAFDKKRVPFFVRYITKDGKVESGQVECISVLPRLKQRHIKFVSSGEIRAIRDYLIIEIDGVKFYTH